MSDLSPLVERAMRAVCACTADALRRYAHVSGMSLADDITECFIPSFVFDRLGDEYAMTLETNATKLLARNAEARGRTDRPVPEQVTKLEEEIGGFDRKRRVDLVLYHDDGSDRSRRSFLSLVEFKLWVSWWNDRPKLVRIMRLLDACPFGAMCFIASGHPDEGWLRCRAEAARGEGDTWLIEALPGVLHKGRPLCVGAQIIHRPAASP